MEQQDRPECYPLWLLLDTFLYLRTSISSLFEVAPVTVLPWDNCDETAEMNKFLRLFGPKDVRQSLMSDENVEISSPYCSLVVREEPFWVYAKSHIYCTYKLEDSLMEHILSNSPTTLRSPIHLCTHLTMPCTHLQQSTISFIIHRGLSTHLPIHNISYLILSAHTNTIT